MVALFGLGFAPVDAASNAAEGKKLFDKNRGICHAIETTVRRIGPSLKGIKDGRLPGAIGKRATHDNILKKIDDGGGGMPAFRELLTHDENENIVAYAMTL